jgi:hypothetical protein
MLEHPQVSFVKNGPVLYPRSEQDYQITVAIGVPTFKIAQTFWPALVHRLEQRKAKVRVSSFEDEHEKVLATIQDKWPTGIIVSGRTVSLEAAKGKQSQRQLLNLVTALQEFYQRHLFKVEVTTRRFPKKIRYQLERKFHVQGFPSWKD